MIANGRDAFEVLEFMLEVLDMRLDEGDCLTNEELDVLDEAVTFLEKEVDNVPASQGRCCDAAVGVPA